MKRYPAHTIESLAISELPMAYPEEITDNMLFLYTIPGNLSSDTGFGSYSITYSDLTTMISNELSIRQWPGTVGTTSKLTSIHIVNGQYAGVNDYRPSR